MDQMSIEQICSSLGIASNSEKWKQLWERFLNDNRTASSFREWFFDKLLNDENTAAAFKTWFWTAGGKENNIANNVIRKLNYGKTGKQDKLRREQHSPTIYFIVINVSIEYDKDYWKFVKVGYTQCDTTKTNEDNRMNEVISKVETKFPGLKQQDESAEKQVDVLFPLLIKATDVNNHFEVEKRLRTYFGVKVPPDQLKAKNENNGQSAVRDRECFLPTHTEWVITTQKYIDIMKSKNPVDSEAVCDNRFSTVCDWIHYETVGKNIEQKMGEKDCSPEDRSKAEKKRGEIITALKTELEKYKTSAQPSSSRT